MTDPGDQQVWTTEAIGYLRRALVALRDAHDNRSEPASRTWESGLHDGMVSSFNLAVELLDRVVGDTGNATWLEQVGWGEASEHADPDDVWFAWHLNEKRTGHPGRPRVPVFRVRMADDVTTEGAP